MTYLLFSASRKEFDDGMSLGEHLDDLAKFGGTPDCWDSIETDNRTVAITKARDSGLPLYIVDETLCRVVGVVNND